MKNNHFSDLAAAVANDKRIAELEQENERLRKALSHAVDAMKPFADAAVEIKPGLRSMLWYWNGEIDDGHDRRQLRSATTEHLLQIRVSRDALAQIVGIRSTLPADVALRLKASRVQAGLSQAQVARFSGLSKEVIIAIEDAAVSISEAVFGVLCNIYDVSEEWAMTGANSCFTDEDRRHLLDNAANSGMSIEDAFKLADLLESLARR